ncbi:hypothetical protein [Halorussus sp. AFM4]|uniref:hypothetical protein n=1 Tax=Halorussus sp. AFM4 TaxID=3421651 RepID=UPI003EBD9D0E
MAPSYNQPEKMDTLTEKTLSALYKRTRAGTGDLRKMTGGKSRSIRHRIDKYLIPNDLVREIDRREHAGNNERVFELTGDGQRLVEDKWSQLTHYAQRDEVLDASRETRKHVDRLHDHIDQFDKRLDRAEDAIDRRLNDAEEERNQLKSNLKGDFSQLREEVKELEEENEELREEVKELSEKVDANEKRSKKTKVVAEEAWAWTVGNWIERVRNPDNGQQMPWMDVRGKIRGAVARNGPEEKRHKKVSREFREWMWGDDSRTSAGDGSEDVG